MNTQRPQPVNRSPRGRLKASAIIVLCLLLAIPGYALSRFAPHVDGRVLIGVPLALSIFAFLVYRSDKRRAETGAWRIPESTLYFVAVIGGWPGAFLAQRMFRHKTSKLSFQFVFWSVVLLHQFAAADSLSDWRLTKEMIRAIRSRIS